MGQQGQRSLVFLLLSIPFILLAGNYFWDSRAELSRARDRNLLAEQERQRAYDCQHQGQGGSGTAVGTAAKAMQAEVVD